MASLSIDSSQTRETGPLQAEFDVLEKLVPAKKWQRPVCLLVDEIQTVTKEHGARLRELHLGEHRLPIVLVCAGLADSVEKIQQAISPRMTIGNVHSLVALPSVDVHSCVKQMFDLCRLNYTSDQLNRIGSGVAKHSEGWPQHVRTETAALFKGLVETKGDLGTVDYKVVDRLASDYREESYLTRRSKEMSNSFDLVAGILRAIPETGILRARVVDIIEAKADQKGQKSGRLPKGMDAEDFLDHLIHQGVLQPDKTGMLSFPIPSLRTWLINLADAALRESAGPETCPPTSEKQDALDPAV